jgi:hypothetical protein
MAANDDIKDPPYVTPPNPSVDAMTIMALNLVDLRAHFEAQLRAVGSADAMLERCRAARDSEALTESLGKFRQDLSRIVSNNASIQAERQLSRDTQGAVRCGPCVRPRGLAPANPLIVFGDRSQQGPEGKPLMSADPPLPRWIVQSDNLSE